MKISTILLGNLSRAYGSGKDSSIPAPKRSFNNAKESNGSPLQRALRRLPAPKITKETSPKSILRTVRLRGELTLPIDEAGGTAVQDLLTDRKLQVTQSLGNGMMTIALVN